jgi:hypothetical protein
VTMKLLSMVALLLLAAQSPAADQPRLAKLQIDSAFVWGQGVWMPDNPTAKNKPIETVTEYTCNRTGGKQLTRTEAWCLEASAATDEGMLSVRTVFLKVVAWDDKQIIAADDSPICLSTQVIFDVKRQTAVALDVRKPEAKGLDDVCKLLPDRQTYYLEEVSDYYTRKALKKL